MRARRRPQDGLPPGTVVGAYRLEGLLGKGGAGLVYRATHIKLGRRVAVKILREELSRDHAAIARFFGEARVVNAIAHDNIVEITDFVERTADGTPSHYVMELLEGETLYALLSRTRIGVKRALHIAVQIADALAAVHAKGIVHRDLKPENVFIGPGDRVKLLDFGVAKLSTEAGLAMFETAAGALVGTPGYMAPEQTLDANVDARADVYALGVLLFEMVTGRPPFAGEDVLSLLLSHRNDPPPDPARVTLGTDRIPRSLSNLILACLDKSADARPRDAHAVLQRLVAMRSSRAAFWSAGAALLLCAVGFVAFRPVPAPVRAAPTPPVVVRIPPIPVDLEATVSLDSEPDGARVLVDGREIGRTPLTKRFRRRSEPMVVTFALADREPVIQTVSLQSDQHVSVALPEPPRPKKKKKKRRRRRALRRKRTVPVEPPRAVSPVKVMNPFAEDR